MILPQEKRHMRIKKKVQEHWKLELLKSWKKEKILEQEQTLA